MKVGIVTLPFNSNYGGILQAYALQSVLKKLGHEVETVNRISKGQPLYFKALSYSKRFVQRNLLAKNVVVRTWPNKKEKSITAQHTRKFIDDYINLTKFLSTEKQFKQLANEGFDAWVVGSDQVWRPKYSPSLNNHFLGFLPENDTSKKISFAPSFGVDHWEYTPSETALCKKLIHRFNAVSVREDSGVELCQKHLGVDAKHLVDPTMLIEKEEYIELVKNDNLPEHDKKLLTYILDKNSRVKEIIKKTEDYLGTESFSTTRKNSFKKVGKNGISECIFPRVTEWIKGFIDAEFVLTDSFHGTVFCIIFNKPFIALGNTKRGMSRFLSLLKIFELEDRLVTEKDFDIDDKLNSKIDFDHVNKILEAKKEEALAFISKALSS